MSKSPAAIISGIDSLSERYQTPCGSGHMCWRVWGKGPPLVLLHGGYGSWTHWIRNVPFLSEHFMVIAPDIPGLGDSDMPPTPFTLMSLGEIIATGLEQILPESRKFDLTGFSFGGIVGGHVAAIMGNRVATLTLVGSGSLGLPRGEMEEFERWHPEMAPEELAAVFRRNLEILMVADPDTVDELALYQQTLNMRRARIKSGAYSHTDDLRRVLPQVKGALKGIWGERDATSKGYIAERKALLGELHPELDFRVIEGAGHWVSYERPEEFNETLLDLLNGEG